MTKFLNVALKAVHSAGKVLMKHYKRIVKAEIKSDKSPVTIADKEAEEIIKKIISKSFPKHGFITEESGVSNISASYKWVIDPIDGTKNFIRSVPIFGILLALLKDDNIILGVSYAPALKELFYAVKGRGAFFNGKRVHVSKVDSLSKAYLSHGNIASFDTFSLVPNLVSLSKSCMAKRGFGDFWSYTLVARGSVDLFVEVGCKIWDWAPVSLIVNEAGGKVTDINGKELTMNSDSIIASNSILHQSIESFFKH